MLLSKGSFIKVNNKRMTIIEGIIKLEAPKINRQIRALNTPIRVGI
jgi:hypothetical protein